MYMYVMFNLSGYFRKFEMLFRREYVGLDKRMISHGKLFDVAWWQEW